MPWPYANIYPQYAHDPSCSCCHPNDRPYCDCACHRQHWTPPAIPLPQLTEATAPADVRRIAQERERRRLAELPGRRAR